MFLAVKYDWPLYKLDIKNTFFHNNLQEGSVLYVVQFHGTPLESMTGINIEKMEAKAGELIAFEDPIRF